MASSEKLQNEILLKEEAFLKEEKAKLTEQLNRLKVEERALLKLLSQDEERQHQNTIELFNQQPQGAEPSSSKQRVGNFEAESEVNQLPLHGLGASQMAQFVGEDDDEEEDDEEEDDEEEDDEEEDDEEEDDDSDIDDIEDDEIAYTSRLMKAVSNLNNQDAFMNNGTSRSVLESILQQEVGDMDDDDDFF